MSRVLPLLLRPVPYLLVGLACVAGVAGFTDAAMILCGLALLLRWLEVAP